MLRDDSGMAECTMETNNPMSIGRTDEEIVGKLCEMGWIDENGMVNVPERCFGE